MLNFLDTIGTLLLFWMEICSASSASGSTVSFLPVPEEGSGFTMRLRQWDQVIQERSSLEAIICTRPVTFLIILKYMGVLS